MQLISTLLLLLSLVTFVGAITFLILWHRLHHKSSIAKILREGIGHIGISAIVEYPETPSPLMALLEEIYPRSEAIIIIDLQEKRPIFEALIHQFHLVKVNHTHLKGARALYRSRHRPFKRITIVDLPAKQRSHATNVAKKVASFDYVLHLPGECQIEYNTLTYCANIIALHPTTNNISLKSIIGAGAQLERADQTPRDSKTQLLTNRALAWHSTTPLFLILAITLPSTMILLARISGENILVLTAIVIALTFAILLYISCRVVTKKGLYTTTNTILKNFCRFLVEKIKNCYYLYKEREPQNRVPAESVELLNKNKITESNYD